MVSGLESRGVDKEIKVEQGYCRGIWRLKRGRIVGKGEFEVNVKKALIKIA